MVAVNYLWDPDEDNIVKELDDAGATIADYTTEPFLYGDMISQHRDGQSRFYHFDTQGNTTELTDTSGNTTDTRRYFAFGETTVSTGSTTFPYQYCGQKGYSLDAVSGQYIARHRPLVPDSARWLCVDPLRHIDGPNVYSYVNNNPTGWLDPTGKRIFGCRPRRRRRTCPPPDRFPIPCCCCASDVPTFEQSRLWRPTGVESEWFWGHYLTIRATFSLIGDHVNGRGCRLQWWECATLESALGQPPDEWDPAHKRERFPSEPYSNLEDYYTGVMPLSCPGSVHVYRKDEPKLPFPKSRTIKFAIRVISEPGCRCPHKDRWLFLTQSLQGGPAARTDVFGEPQGYKEWVIRPGISDREEPTACTKQLVVWSANRKR